MIPVKVPGDLERPRVSEARIFSSVPHSRVQGGPGLSARRLGHRSEPLQQHSETNAQFRLQKCCHSLSCRGSNLLESNCLPDVSALCFCS